MDDGSGHEKKCDNWKTISIEFIKKHRKAIFVTITLGGSGTAIKLGEINFSSLIKQLYNLITINIIVSVLFLVFLVILCNTLYKVYETKTKKEKEILNFAISALDKKQDVEIKSDGNILDVKITVPENTTTDDKSKKQGFRIVKK